MRLPLRGAEIKGATITCPWYHSVSDSRTGDVQAWSPWPRAVGRILGALSREKAIALYPARVEEGTIRIGREDG
jgi:nitrite reductase/ring-hydroxylating ferredoxin subunit